MKENYINLIKTKFKEFVIQQDNEFGVMSHNKFLSFSNKTYQERILFSIGPQQIICGNSTISNNYLNYEDTNENKKRSDVAYISDVNEDGNVNKKILGIFENKIIETYDENSIKDLIREGFQQILHSYIQPYQDEGKLLNNKDEKNMFFASLMIYYPKKYLESSLMLAKYLDDSKKAEENYSKLIEKYGFLCLTLFMNNEDIKKFRKEGAIKFNKGNQKLSHVFPILHSIKGFPRNDCFGTEYNISFISRINQLKNLPLWNIDVNSGISNTRDIIEDNKISNTYFLGITETLVNNFKNMDSSSDNNDEFFRSTGSKPREVSFDINQTIVYPIKKIKLSNRWYDNLKNEYLYISTNMSMVDGQHSSQIYINFYDMFANTNYKKFDDLKDKGKTIKRILKKVGYKLPDQKFNDFKEFITDTQLIEVNIRGFHNQENAKQNARNQNQVRQQSRYDQYLDDKKGIIKNIAQIYNTENLTSYIKVTKDALSFPAFSNTKNSVTKIDYENMIWLSTIFKSNLEKEDKHKYFLANNFSANLGTNWEKSINFYQKEEPILEELEELMFSREDPYYENEDEQIDICAYFSELKNRLNKIKKDLKNTTAHQQFLDNIIEFAVEKEEEEFNSFPEEKKLKIINDFFNKIKNYLQQNTIIIQERVLVCGSICKILKEFTSKKEEKKLPVFEYKTNAEVYFSLYVFSLLKESVNEIDDLFLNLKNKEEKINIICQLAENNLFNIKDQFNEEKIKKSQIGTNKADNEIISKLYNEELILQVKNIIFQEYDEIESNYEKSELHKDIIFFKDLTTQLLQETKGNITEENKDSLLEEIKKRINGENK